MRLRRLAGLFLFAVPLAALPQSVPKPSFVVKFKYVRGGPRRWTIPHGADLGVALLRTSDNGGLASERQRRGTVQDSRGTGPQEPKKCQGDGRDRAGGNGLGSDSTRAS